MKHKSNKTPSYRELKKILYSEKKYKKVRGRSDEKGLMVMVDDDNIGLALKRLKRKTKDACLFEEYKEHERYVKPSVKKRKKKNKIKCKMKWDKILKAKLEEYESQINGK